MKILQISSAQSLGGGERHLTDLAKGLARRGHDVYVAARPNSPLIPELRPLPAANITTLPLRNSFDARSARHLSKLINRKGIQIVHAHMARDYPLAAYATRMNPQARLIVTRHVLFRLNRLHRLTLAKAARIIAVSHAVAAQLQADGVVPREKISVVLNGIDTQRFHEARKNFARREFLNNWELPENTLLIGTVGELTPLKGQLEFIRAALPVLQRVPNAAFIIAGVDHSREQEHRSRIEQLIGELKLTGQIRLVGWLDDLAQLYCALDVFVSASHTESFGLSLAEAMASGTAVLATETEGARELIRPGETGLMVPTGVIDELAEAMVLLLNDRDLRGRLGTAAQQDASTRFSVGRMIEETEKIYQAELEEQSSRTN